MAALPYEWQLGWRLVRARRGGGFVSFIAAASMLGIALGVAALVVVLSVVNGFQREVRERMLDVVPHVDVQSAPGADAVLLEPLLPQLRDAPGVVAAAPFAQAQALLGRGETLRGALLRGIDPALEPAVSALVRGLPAATLARLQPGGRQIVLGHELARSLGARPGDTVMLVQAGPGGAPRLAPLTLAGVFDSGHFEFDQGLALLHASDLLALAPAAAARGVALRLADADRAPALAMRLRATLDAPVSVGDWTRTNRNWFESVQIQKRMIGVILALIIAVAAFNLTSTLVMTVTDRQGDIAILRTLGASPASVMAIFLVQGAASGLIGTAGGLALGLSIAGNLDRIVPAIESLVGRRLLEAQVYLIDHMPSEARAAEVATIAAVSIALSLAATLYPSWRASRVRPAEALRHE